MLARGGHLAPRLPVGLRQCGCARRGRGDFRSDRGGGPEAWLASLREELGLKTYRSAPVRRVRSRSLGRRTPSAPDDTGSGGSNRRQARTGTDLEADFEDGANGYRPGRSAADAIKEVHRLICRATPMSSTPICRMRTSSNRWPAAHIVNYADEFVILSQRSAAEALTSTPAVMTNLGLTLNGAKTSVKDAQTGRFDFLGYTFGPTATKGTATGTWEQVHPRKVSSV